MIKTLKKDACEMEILSLADFEQYMGIRWQKKLRFIDPSYEKKACRRAAIAMRKKEMSLRETWLGIHFCRELALCKHPDFSIRYVDPILGYGVFAEEVIAKGRYIGEYTGVIRKRKRGVDRKNEYCFEYTIGDWIYNPFLIDAMEEGNMTRFMNHSEKPNVESLSVFSDGLMHIIFIAEKRIEPGTQLCYHYGDTFWKKRRRKILVNVS